MGLHPDGVDHGIRPSASGAQPQPLGGTVEVGGLDAVPFGERPPLGYGVDPVHLVAAVPGDTGGELPDRTEPDDRDRPARFDVGVLDALPRRGQDVAQEEVAIVGQFGADREQVEVGTQHAQPLGLSAGDRAVELRVAVERRPRVLLPHLSGLALRGEPALAHEARAARDHERHDDAVARRDPDDGAADLLDDAHRLVPEDVAAMQERREHVVEVQVGPADRGRGDPHDRVGGLLDARIGDLVDGDLGRALPGECSHPPGLSERSRRVETLRFRPKCAVAVRADAGLRERSARPRDRDRRRSRAGRRSRWCGRAHTRRPCRRVRPPPGRARRRP